MLNTSLCTINLIFSDTRNNLLLEEIENSKKSKFKKYKGKVIFMKHLNKLYIILSIAQMILTFKLQGAYSMFLYIQYSL
nr:MAG TPA: hypothetical protein [Caudoviricetes sp.]